MRRATSAVLLLVWCASLLAVPLPARAWTAPSSIPGSEGRFPQLAALLAGGGRVALLTGPLALFAGTPQVPVAFSTAPAGAAFGRPVGLGNGLALPVAISPAGRVIAVAGPRGPQDYFGGEGIAGRLRIAIGRLGSPARMVAAPTLIATRVLDAAVNDRGDAVVLFARCESAGCSRTGVWAAFRRAGSAFGRAVALARKSDVAAGAVTINSVGDTLLAWTARAPVSGTLGVEARLHLADGRFTRARRVGPTAPRPTIALTLSAHRAGVVAWFTEPVSEGSAGGYASVHATAIRAGGTMGKARRLDAFTPPVGDGTAVADARLRAILDPDGTTTLAWTGHGADYVVRSARIPGSASPQTISPVGESAELADLAGDNSGDAIAVWISGVHEQPPGATTNQRLGAAIRRGGVPQFDAPETPLARDATASTAAAAIAPGPRLLVVFGAQTALDNTHHLPGVSVIEDDRSGH